MLNKPSCRQPRNLLELALFFEKMGRPGDDFEALLSVKFCERFAVPREHLAIGFSDDEERWCGNFRWLLAQLGRELFDFLPFLLELPLGRDQKYAE